MKTGRLLLLWLPLLLVVTTLLTIALVVQRFNSICLLSSDKFVKLLHSSETKYSRNILSNEEPLIFVGGIPRSGTTLMRVMLDAHPKVRCGEETMIIPAILSQRLNWQGEFFKESGLTQKAIDASVSAFLLEMIRYNGQSAERLCNKDPFTGFHSKYLSQLFPNAKFILMLRDPRAIIHSMIERDVPVSGFDHNNTEQMFTTWERDIKIMLKNCKQVKENCIKVYYERLVQLPAMESHRISSFLSIDWSDEMINHQQLIGKEINLNPREFSTSQVKEEVNVKSLSKWKDALDSGLLKRLINIAPTMDLLGYNKAINGDYSWFASEDFETIMLNK